MQTTKSDQMEFHEQTDSFQITVAISPNRLCITLKDLVDWIVYQKQYTEEDVGGQIHKKMDLSDVYSVFAQTKAACDEENMKLREEESVQLKRYQFGSIVEKDNLPCYKIEKGGKLTVFLVLFDKNRKELIFQSKLNLTKTKNMTEKQIVDIKLARERVQTHKEMQKYRKEKEELQQRVTILEKQNKNLHEDLSSTKQELKKMKIQLNSKIEEQANDLKLLETRLTSSIASCKQSKINLAQLRNQLKYQMKNLLKQSSIDPEKQMLEKIKDKANGAKNYMNLPQASSKYLKIDGFQVQHINKDTQWTHYIFNQQISYNKTAKFRIKIIKTKLRYIFIGVVDYEKQKDEFQSRNSGNSVSYYSCGFKWPEQVEEGHGFGQGDVVEVQVDRKNKTVMYLVNGVLNATQSNQMLADEGRVFMPFVELYSMNDIVEWLPIE